MASPQPLDYDIDRLLQTMAQAIDAQLSAAGREAPLMVGIRTGGVWLAERLAAQLGIQESVGELDISFYRDDFSRIGLNPSVRPSRLPVPTESRHLVLVDDVLMSGRTVRAAMNELFDYGRPESILLACLVDVGRRELPVQPDVTGLTLSPEPHQRVKLQGPEPLILEMREAADL